MAAQFCNRVLEELVHLVLDYRTLITVLCVLNFIFTPVAILGNLLIIRALLKALSIPVNLKKLLLSLAFSDLGVGLFVQFTYGVLLGAMLKMAANGNYNFNFLCPTILTVVHFFLYLLLCTSFLNITAIAVDRLLAVSLHLRYQELVTSKRLIITLVLVWLTSGVAASIYVSVANTLGLETAALGCVGLFLTTVANIRIYTVVRYHQNQIQSQFQQANNQAMGLLRQKKSALNALFVYAVFVVCYIPEICASMLHETSSSSTLTTAAAVNVAGFIVFLNSSLNPLVYCWRFREIRQLVKSTVKNVFRISET